MTAKTFTQEIQSAHSRGDEDTVNELLDLKNAVRTEVRERIEFANNAAADFAHQLHALGVLIDGAKENGISLEDGEAPLLSGIGVATSALQDWMDR
jgi:hypothetical protein